MSGNTGFAGGTQGADPVPATAPDGSTVLDASSEKVVSTEGSPPESDTGKQNQGEAVSPYDPGSEEQAVG